MSDAKQPFILHTEYETFTPGSSPLIFNTLLPYRYEVNLRGEGMWFWVWVGLSMMLFGLIASSAGIYLFGVQPFIYEHYSQEISAQVVSCRIKTYAKSGDVPILTYTYRWENQEFTRSAGITGHKETCSDYLDQAISVRVLTIDPGQSRPTFAWARYFDAIMLAAFCVFILLDCVSLYGVYFLLRLLLAYWRAKRMYPRLQQATTILTGEILRVSGHMNTKPPEYVVKVNYTFETPQQRRLTGWVEVVREDLRDKLPPAGTPITILYADDNAYTIL